MGLDLVDGRDNLVVVDEVHQPVQVEVRDPDCTGEAVLVDFLHGAPLAELSGDEEFVAGDAAVLDGRADGGLVASSYGRRG
ncbi:hypothetical protein AB4Z38_17385 [Arthrobacter sp. 2RAF6]|uniref:hypothetical protein n=1 Tax=Arthrobacter sp. 2RAF6 TaxID=3233002 RepID=UPI003F8F1139